MKILLTKKKLYISIILFLLGVLLFATGYFLIKKNAFSISDYSNLSSYCTTSNDEISCRGFLSDSTTTNGSTCLKATLISEDLSQNETEICANKSRIDWENPYGDYNELVPVTIVINTKGIIVTVMSDSDTLSLIYQLNDTTSFAKNVYLKQTQDMKEKGYYTGNNLLYLLNATLTSYTIKDDVITLNFVIDINSTEFHISIPVTFLQYLKSDSERATIITKSNMEEVPTGEDIQISFIYDPTLIPDIDSYISQKIQEASNSTISFDDLTFNTILQ